MKLTSLALVLLALLLLPAAGQAQSSPQRIARVDRPTPVAVHAGRVAWSQREPGTERYRLMSHADGVTAPVPVPTRAVPFDVDLGPDAEGATSAVYSRCATEPPAGGYRIAQYLRGRRCDIYRFSFATGREERVAAVSSGEDTEAWPTIWRSRIGFARAFNRKRDYPYLYVNDVSDPDRSRRMPGGQRKTCAENRDLGRPRCTDDRHSAPAELDLYGRRLAFSWRYTDFAEGFAYDLRLDDVLARDGAPRRLDTVGGGGLTAIVLGWPSFHAGRLQWSRACFGDPGGCPRRRNLVNSAYVGSRLASTRWDPRRAVWSHDRDGSRTYLLRDDLGSGGTECRGDPEIEGGTCELVAVEADFR